MKIKSKTLNLLLVIFAIPLLFLFISCPVTVDDGGGGNDSSDTDDNGSNGDDDTAAAYSVTYHANEGTAGTVPTDATEYSSGDVVTVLDNTGNLAGAVIRDGIRQRFIGWNTDSGATTTEYVADDTFSITEDTTLYAIYTTGTDVLRKVGPAGGWVFYDAGSTKSWGRYLEAANYGWYDGGDDPTSQWGGYDEGINGTYTAIGTGADNTSIICSFIDSLHLTTDESTTYYDYDWADLTSGTVTFTDGSTDYELDYRNDGTVAAKPCADYSVVYDGTTYDDWFLPSKNELNEMYGNLHEGDGYDSVGGFASAYYWSSSEDSQSIASTQVFADGGQGGSDKGSGLRVRAARAF
jgi:hypothetical protein